jgi:hypothetical protein|tara:strand:- start:337 stop:546 length:210 start_codon:yes stop_codon:yes gene_type:complete
MDEKHLGDQFPFIGGQAMGINNNQTLRYKLWMALVKLSELTADDSVNDGADFAFSIENEIVRLEKELDL